MKLSTKGNSDFNYDEVVSLACLLWQDEGCPFGRYQVCWQQAKSEILSARAPARAKAIRRGHKG